MADDKVIVETIAGPALVDRRALNDLGDLLRELQRRDEQRDAINRAVVKVPHAD